MLEFGQLADDLLKGLVHGAQRFLIAPIGVLVIGPDRCQRILQRLQLGRRSGRLGLARPILHKTARHAIGCVLGHIARPIAVLLHALIELMDRLLERRNMLELLLGIGETVGDTGKFALDARPGLLPLILAHRRRDAVVEIENPLLELGDLIADMIAAALLEPFGDVGQAAVEIGERAQVGSLRDAR